MTQTSYFWDGVTTGDSSNAPYTDVAMRNVLRKLLLGPNTEEGLIASSVIGERLLVEKLTADVVRVNPGAAIVNGAFYYIDSQTTFTITRPSYGAYYYVVVLRQDVPSQQVRVVMKGPQTDDYPSVTQDSIYHEIIIGWVQVLPTGILSVYMQQKMLLTNHMKLLAILARKGGSATDWVVAGTTNYDLISAQVKIQFGIKQWTGALAGSGNLAVTFPVAYDTGKIPIVIVTPYMTTQPSPGSGGRISTSVISTVSGTTIYWRDLVYTYTALNFAWFAVGECAKY